MERTEKAVECEPASSIDTQTGRDQRSEVPSIREEWGYHHPKTVVGVAEAGTEAVADGAARVPRIVVERAAPQHPAALGCGVFSCLSL